VKYFRRGAHVARGRRHRHNRVSAAVSVASLIVRYGQVLGVSMAALA
jgi:hypothetical protein